MKLQVFCGMRADTKNLIQKQVYCFQIRFGLSFVCRYLSNDYKLSACRDYARIKLQKGSPRHGGRFAPYITYKEVMLWLHMKHSMLSVHSAC